MDNNNTNTSGSFRAKRNPFTQVSNSALRDNNLSLKAKGLYSLIQSYITIPNFTLYKGHLISMCKEKEKAFNSAWKELKDNGYLKQYRIPKGKNDTFVYEYDLLDIADLTTPSLINLNKNSEEIKNDNENTGQKDSNSHTPHLVPYANSITCGTDNMPTVPHAERGGNNNIDFKKDLKKEEFKDSYTDSNHILSNRFTPSTESYPQSDEPDIKTNEMRCDTIPTQTGENEKGQKNKESFKNATADQSNKAFTKPSAVRYSVAEVEEIIKSNIRYDDILIVDPHCQKMLDGVLQVIVSTIVTDFKNGYISMGDENVPAEVVRGVFFKLTQSEIEYFIENFNRQTDPTIKLTPYIRTSLFRNHRINDFYWSNRVHVDMPQLAEKKIHSKRE